jgi:hypothetical protein
MWGRYRLSRRKQIIAEHFDAVPFEDDWEPRYNIAPTHTRGRSCCPGFEPKHEVLYLNKKGGTRFQMCRPHAERH